MDTARIAELLTPFAGQEMLTPPLLQALQRYLDLLLLWNAKVNLTAVRDPEKIVTRHFGESLFAAQVLLAGRSDAATPTTLTDVGSGAGFPGLPMKLFDPSVELTLIESHNKRAIFLRDAVRHLGLDGVEVFCGRAEDWGKTADLVTLRAVERFELVLPVAARLAAENGRLGLLIGAGQVSSAQNILGQQWDWSRPVPVPLSASRVVFEADKNKAAHLA
jgi:16S rRNA (guanine527-N7)-methyltransferase